MGWDQSYDVPNEVDLLEKILGVTAMDLLRQEMDRRGIKITDRRDFTVAEGQWGYEIGGQVITLSDGRSLRPRLCETYRTDDSGVDTYKWCWSDETPLIVEYRDHGNCEED